MNIYQTSIYLCDKCANKQDEIVIAGLVFSKIYQILITKEECYYCGPYKPERID